MNKINNFFACLFFIFSLSTWGSISVSPGGPYSVSAGFGQTSSVDLTVSNVAPSSAAKVMAVFEGEGGGDLADVLTSMNDSEADILATLTDRYLFSDGVTGSQIWDGGGDMYDGGNYLRFGASANSSLPYSDGVVTDSADGSVRYFTRKYDGLFVLAADYKAHTSFHITGNLGADGSGQVTLRKFDAGHGYRAFVKTVSGASDPSINHLILVPNGDSLARTSPTTTYDDTHSVTGLSPNGRLYHLLFAKASGQTFSEAEIQDLADAFLRSVQVGPSWFSFPYNQLVNSGASRVLPVTLDANGLDAGVYTTRFAIVEQGTRAEDLPASAFQPMTFTVGTASFTLAQNVLDVAGLESGNPDPLTVDLTPAVTGLLGTVQVDGGAPWLTINRIPGENRLNVSFNTSSLAVGYHSSDVTITQGATSQVVRVNLQVSPLNIVQLLPDPTRSKIYAINQNGKDRGSLLVIDIATQIIQRNIPLGLEPSDMDLTENAAELLVMNTSDPSIYRVNLGSLEVADVYQLSEFSNRNDDVGGHVEDGPGDVIYYVDEQWGPRLRVFDATTETVLQTFGSGSGSTPNISNDTGFGDIKVSPDATQLFGWHQYGDGAGNVGTGVTQYVIQADGTLTDFTKSGAYYSNTPNFRRDPFDSPILLTEDGSRLAIKDRVIDQTDLDVHPIVYPDEIYAISSSGEIASGANAIYSGESGNVMHQFSNSVPVQVITPDDSTLVYFETSSQTLNWLDLDSVLATSGLSLTPSISDGAGVIGVDQTLSWSAEPRALYYDVYFGTNQNAVNNAGSGSAEYQGRVTGTSWEDALPALALGTQYFWRVDIIGYNDSQKGGVWSFDVAPIMVSPIERTLHAPINAPIPNQSHQLSADAALSWTASSSTPWISVITTSGTTDATLTYAIHPTGLTVGSYTGAVQITTGGETFDLPVSVVLHNLNVVHVQNAQSPTSVFALSTTPQADGPSFLLDVNAATGVISRFIEAGINATDFDVATNQNRVYFANYGQDESPVVDLEDWNHLQPLNLNEGVRYIEATPDGLLVLEQTSNYRTLLYDPADGSELNNTYFSGYSNSTLSSDGTIYYHRSSYSRFAAYRIENNTFEKVGDSESLGSGSGDLISNEDGSRIFFTTTTFNRDLEAIASIPQGVYATDRRGAIAVGQTGIYWANSGREIHSLSTTSTKVALSSDDQYLVRYLASSGRFESVRMDSIVDLPGAIPQPGVVLTTPPTEFSVPPISGATGYQLFIGTSPTDMRLMMNQTSPQFSLAQSLSPHSYYYWRVDAGSASGRVTGDVHDFSTVIQSSPVEASTDPVSSVAFQDRRLLTGRSDYPNYQMNAFAFDHTSGEAELITSAKRSGAYSSSSPYGSSVVMAGGRLYTIDAEGLVQLSRNEYGYWSQSDPIPVESSPNLIRGLRADGDLLFVSVDDSAAGSNNKKIHIYRTFPELVLAHTVEVPTAESVREFASVFEVSGDCLVVLSKALAYPYLPKLWIYHRNSNTGSWQLSDKELFPDALYNSRASLLATDGKSIAFSYTASGGQKIAIFHQQSAGVFLRETTFSVDDFPHHSSYNFPSSLSLDQDYLVIGDRTATNLPGTRGLVYVSKRMDGTWEHLPPLMVKGPSNVGIQLDVADGWVVTSHSVSSGQPYSLSLFQLDASTNRRPLITSERPYQVVAGHQVARTITVSDDDSVKMFLDQAPAWLSLSPSGNDFELSGSVPSTLVGGQTVRIRVADSHGVSSCQTFDLQVLASDDVPTVVTLPDSGELGAGQSITLTPVVSGTGPFTWQWFKDGVAIEGATDFRLALDFLKLGDGGVYSFEVSNTVTTTTSEGITIGVRPANRFAGDWPMFGNGPRHLGYHPATFGTHKFLPAWSKELGSGGGLNRVVVAEGKVFATYSSREAYVWALSLTDGAKMWQKILLNTHSINPPSYHDGRVLFQRRDWSDGAHLWSLDATKGEVDWSVSHGAQWEYYESPTVTGDGVWVNGGTYGGMYGFDLDGNQHFFESLPQYDKWTPTVNNGRLFSWVAGVFKEHATYSGSELWSLDIGWSWHGWSMNTVAAVTSDIAVVRSSTEIVCIDLNTREVRWRAGGAFVGSPSIQGDYAYAILGSDVVSYRLDNGEAGPSFICPATITSQQPLLLNDHLVCSTQTETYVFDLTNEDPIQVLPTGGLLSYSQGYLLTAANDGTLSAYFANDIPDFDDQVLADATEDVYYSQTIQTVHDDAEELIFTLLSGPSWISLTPEGELRGTLRHTQGGVQTVRVQVSDGVTDPVVKEYEFNGIEVNDRPESSPLEMTVDEDSPEFFIALGDYFEDEETLDADLIYEIVQNDNPTLLDVVLTNDQRISVSCLKDQYGTAVLTLKATDAGGLSVQTTMTITVDPVNDRPVFTEDLPDITTNHAGGPRGLDVAPYVFDADPDDSLFYEIVGNTNPSIFASVTIGGLSGQLEMVFAPYVSGVSDLTIRVTDLEGEFSEQVIAVTLPELPLPGLVAGEIQMNRQTGLYSQVVTVTNNAGRSIGGFLLYVNGLVNGYQLYGMPGNIVRYLTPVAPRESRTFTLEYYSASSGVMPTPEFVLELAQPEDQDPPLTLGVIIEQVYVLEDRSILLEFVTVPGKRYSIQYSDDLILWHTSPVSVTASANRTQWLDQGLPRTLCHPSECTSRLYRILELSDAQN